MLLQPKTSSKWHAAGLPIRCAGCGQPFPRGDKRVRCLNTENGYFCDEFCEADHLIALAAAERVVP